MDINARLAERIRKLRKDAGLSLDELASKTGVSRSMISMIERNQSSATATVLERLASGLGLTLADLFAADTAADTAAEPLLRRAGQTVWRDPQSGYIRRNLSPAAAHAALQLVEVVFPGGARIAYETGLRQAVVHQQIWLLSGQMHISVGEQVYQLHEGDCLAFELNSQTAFYNPTQDDARYLVAIYN
ncbi:transcriptional regulator with XRE-family HTH domain [Silvimonas terrae]|uniref:Transcriptional regulator with XRE-family HTH domain n=1 Tax=Silvimonas terrae TaxID=300266 RepID=A0A840RBA0_9NEIS|nr:XRE family transcriptional regulator [Silvimonas terrae]MBB5190625.1 transcriptional regulator with XRE-family HTH domain [Silvimonas terrae]